MTNDNDDVQPSMDEKELELFNSLNIFISIISESDNSYDNQLFINNFLRSNLLSYLRFLQFNINYNSNFKINYRDILLQWWITILNFIKNKYDIQLTTDITMSSIKIISSFDLTLLSVLLECISRLLTVLMTYDYHSDHDWEIYSNNILMTIHIITNDLILISKSLRFLKKKQQPSLDNDDTQLIKYFNQYSSSLRFILGKLNAYSFIFIPDNYEYDKLLLNNIFVNGKIPLKISYKEQEKEELNTSDNTNLLFQRKKIQFNILNTKNFIFSTNIEKNLKSYSPDYQSELKNDIPIFKIIISYLKNDDIFTSFYWHYWYIVLRSIENSNSKTSSNNNIDLKKIFSSEILITYATRFFLDIDLRRFNNFMKSGEDFSALASSPNADSMKRSLSSGFISNSQINEFIFINFRSIKLWEALRNLNDCFTNNNTIFNNLLILHNNHLLSYVSKFSTNNNSDLANLIYNKILQFIIFQFDDLSFLQWNRWINGILSLIKTLNSDNQCIAILFLINNWNFLPNDMKLLIFDELFCNNKNLKMILIENYSNLVKILFIKLLIFCIIRDQDNFLNNNDNELKNESIKKIFNYIYDKMNKIYNTLSYETLKKISIEEKDNDILIFLKNKKFSLMVNKQPNENDLIVRLDRLKDIKITSNKIYNFPTVSSIANIRPTVFIRKGKFPYDAIDDMIVKDRFVSIRTSTFRSLISSGSGDNKSSTLSSSSSSSNDTNSNGSGLKGWFSFSKFTNSETTNDNDEKNRNEEEESENEEENESDDEEEDMIQINDLEMIKIPTVKPKNKEQKEFNNLIDNNKVVLPCELKYSNKVTNNRSISMIFTLKILPIDLINEKVRKANDNWGIDNNNNEIDDDNNYIMNRNKELPNIPNKKDDNNNELKLIKPNFRIFTNKSAIEYYKENTNNITPTNTITTTSNDDDDTNDNININELSEKDKKIYEKNQKMIKLTEFKKYYKIIKLFNETINEYYRFCAFKDHKTLFVDFEIRLMNGGNMNSNSSNNNNNGMI